MTAIFKEPVRRIDKNGIEYHCPQIDFIEYRKAGTFDAIDFKVSRGAEIEHWVIPIHNIAAIIC